MFFLSTRGWEGKGCVLVSMGVDGKPKSFNVKKQSDKNLSCFKPKFYFDHKDVFALLHYLVT